jgi:hypothetical protein
LVHTTLPLELFNPFQINVQKSLFLSQTEHSDLLHTEQSIHTPTHTHEFVDCERTRETKREGLFKKDVNVFLKNETGRKKIAKRRGHIHHPHSSHDHPRGSSKNHPAQRNRHEQVLTWNDFSAPVFSKFGYTEKQCKKGEFFGTGVKGEGGKRDRLGLQKCLL